MVSVGLDCQRYGLLLSVLLCGDSEPLGLIPSVKSAQSAAMAAWDGIR
jgi:hypothetical protein